MLKTLRVNFDRHEMRRDRRYPLPAITVTLAAGTYTTSNWSLGGFLLSPRIEVAAGTCVSGTVTTADGGRHAFSAEVVRQDADGSGFRFVAPSEALVGALDRVIAHRLFRKRA